MDYEIPTKLCDKCGEKFDWICVVCPKCYPKGVIDWLQELTGTKKNGV